MTSALIGHTGFVGGNLLRHHAFDELYNSKNIDAIAGRRFDLLVCAGAPAEKWRANEDPQADRSNLFRLMSCLSTVSAKQTILISTVDVYPTPVGVDEVTPFEAQSASAYGYHRYMLEAYFARHFEALIVRMPGLFGTGLKKNVVYDFLHSNQLDLIHADSVYQYYNLRRLWPDIQTALKQGLKLVNFATEPVRTGDLAREVFGVTFDRRPHESPARYDFRSRHAHGWGGREGYLYGRDQVLGELREFVQDARRTAE